MKFHIERTEFDGKITFNGEISMLDIVRLDLNPIDRFLLNDKEESAADCLLKLEMLFRRGNAEKNRSDP